VLSAEKRGQPVEHPLGPRPPRVPAHPPARHRHPHRGGPLRSAAGAPDRTVRRLPPRRVAAAPLVRRQRQAHVVRPIGDPGTLPHPSSVPRPRSSPRRPAPQPPSPQPTAPPPIYRGGRTGGDTRAVRGDAEG